MRRVVAWTVRATCAFAALAGSMIPGGRAAAQAPADPEQQLAERFAPIVMLTTQYEPCDAHGEPYAPMAVDSLLGNPQVALRVVGNADPVVTWGPVASDLYGLGDAFYLDLPGDALQPGCTYERDYRRYVGDSRPVVYAHIARQADEPGLLAVQYWLFWYFNDWNDRHEGDWEFVQVLLPTGSVTEALTIDPIGVGYAQHSGGERADWDSDELEREGDRPVVYSSDRSHASYLGSALFLGRNGAEGFGCDNTDGPSVRVDPEVVLLPDTVDRADDEFAWLAFDGRWGERQAAPNDGPTGPYAKPRWTAPVDWHEGLRTSSFVIPGGDSPSRQVIGAFCSIVEWGSLQFFEFQSSPTQIIVSLVLLALLIRWIVHRTSWRQVEPVPLIARRRAGEVVRASLELYRHRPLLFGSFGLIGAPLIALAALAGSVASRLPVVGGLASLLGEDRGGTLAASLLIGGVSTALGTVAVSACAARALDAMSRGDDPTPGEVVRFVGGRSRSLLAGLGLAALVVGLIELTVIGTPIAIVLLVGYQLMAPAVIVEGRGGRAALTRSRELVRGRWWRTAIVLSAVGAVVGGLGLVVGVLVLVTVTSLPLWMLTVIVTAVHVLVLPVAGIVVTLLYGDSVAAEQGLTEPADSPRVEGPILAT